METKRLILRKARMTDIEDAYQMRSSEFVLKYNAMKVLTYDQLVEQVKEHTEVDDIFYLELKETGKVIGVISLDEDHLRYGVHSHCLSYYLNEMYTGQGYMSEALRTVIHHAFCVLKAEVVSARVFKGNEASCSLIEHLGFIKEGELRKCVKGYKDVIYDDMIYAMLKEDYVFNL